MKRATVRKSFHMFFHRTGESIRADVVLLLKELELLSVWVSITPNGGEFHEQQESRRY